MYRQSQKEYQPCRHTRTSESLTFLLTLLSFVIGLLLESANVSAEKNIGLTAYSRGTVSAQYTGGDVRLLGRGADIFLHDVVTTGAASYAIVNLHDKTQVSIRPDSVVSMDDYSEEPKKESVTMELFKGGLRSITGYLAERNPDGMKVQTKVGLIGLKGGKMDVRLCEEGECQNKAGTME